MNAETRRLLLELAEEMDARAEEAEELANAADKYQWPMGIHNLARRDAFREAANRTRAKGEGDA